MSRFVARRHGAFLAVDGRRYTEKRTMTKQAIEVQLKRAKKRMKYFLHPGNATTTKIRTVLKIEEEIDFLETELKKFKAPVINGVKDPYAIEIV